MTRAKGQSDGRETIEGVVLKSRRQTDLIQRRNESVVFEELFDVLDTAQPSAMVSEEAESHISLVVGAKVEYVRLIHVVEATSSVTLGWPLLLVPAPALPFIQEASVAFAISLDTFGAPEPREGVHLSFPDVDAE